MKKPVLFPDPLKDNTFFVISGIKVPEWQSGIISYAWFLFDNYKESSYSDISASEYGDTN
jgi:hypothetical protein